MNADASVRDRRAPSATQAVSNTVLVVIAHPDDEVFVSGTLCLLAEHGFEAEIVCITNGENGDGVELTTPRAATALSEIRRRELQASAAVLGVKTLSFLDQPDATAPHLPGPGAWNVTWLTQALADKIRTLRPALILTHGAGGGYGHEAHKLAHLCVMAAATEYDGSVFTFCGKVPGAFFSWMQDEDSDVRIDAKSFIDQRTASVAYHHSQNNFFLHPAFPSTPLQYASAAMGLLFCWTERGRRRVPIGAPLAFVKRFPVEGLALKQAPAEGHFFEQRLPGDARVHIGRGRRAGA